MHRQRREVHSPKSEFGYVSIQESKEKLDDVLVEHVRHGWELQATIDQLDHPSARVGFQGEVLRFSPMALSGIEQGNVPNGFVGHFLGGLPLLAMFEHGCHDFSSRFVVI